MPKPATDPRDKIHFATYGEADGCYFVTRQVAWLRPVATFSRIGPALPPGTRLGMLGGLVRRGAGALNLYHVAAWVGGRVREGYVALSDAETSPCARWHPPDLTRIRSAAVDLLDSYGAERRARRVGSPPG